MNKTIFVLGGDGYLGWPLAMRLAATRPTEKILIIDNGWRRFSANEFGYGSLIPIFSLPERVSKFNEINKTDNLCFLQLDINTYDIEELLRREKPHTIYHLAEQSSAPYSMKGKKEAVFTLQNNETGNMRILWNLRNAAPDTHLVKMGSFGEYSKGGIDVAEGYFYPEYKGKKSARPMPFPREADDIYHISKINDSNYIAMACRKWGLKVTDVMQSTIYGTLTEEMNDTPELFTRFDYDEIFGTVLNRFLVEIIAGAPLTIYGSGEQRTGLMALSDTVNSIASLADNAPERGTHKVINHVTETRFSINELAKSVNEIAKKEGYKIQPDSHSFDPRNETEKLKQEYGIETGYIQKNIIPSSFSAVIAQTLKHINNYKEKINRALFPPSIYWSSEDTRNRKSLGNEVVSADNDTWFEQFRQKYFPIQRINLNPGTFGTISKPVKDERWLHLSSSELDAHPVRMYQYGRKAAEEIVNCGRRIWDFTGYEMYPVVGTSQTMNLLSLCMLRALHKEKKTTIKVLTTTHEHGGGIGSFLNLPEYEVTFVDDETLADKEKCIQLLEKHQTDIAFFSHVFYDTGKVSDVDAWCNIIKAQAPNCKIIIDIAQSLGLYELPFGMADVLIGSTHKWLFGPHGGGLIWLKPEFKNWIGSLYWGGDAVKKDAENDFLFISGGQDFTLYSSMLTALNLYENAGKELVPARSASLAAHLKRELNSVLDAPGLEFEWLNENVNSAMLSIGFKDFNPYFLYNELADNKIHIKCIMNHKINGNYVNILRFGLPYYESKPRLDKVVNEMKTILRCKWSQGSGSKDRDFHFQKFTE